MMDLVSRGTELSSEERAICIYPSERERVRTRILLERESETLAVSVRDVCYYLPTTP